MRQNLSALSSEYVPKIFICHFIFSDIQTKQGSLCEVILLNRSDDVIEQFSVSHWTFVVVYLLMKHSILLFSAKELTEYFTQRLSSK